jgi:hypothetical protein
MQNRKGTHSIALAMSTVGPSSTSFFTIAEVFRLELERQKRWIFMLEVFTTPGCVDDGLLTKIKSGHAKGAHGHAWTHRCIILDAGNLGQTILLTPKKFHSSRYVTKILQLAKKIPGAVSRKSSELIVSRKSRRSPS